MRDRYGRSQFGQSVLLARRLVEAGVSLVQVNWYRGPDEPPDNPCWDSHTKEAERLKNVLVPPMDQAFSALLEDLTQRGLLDETLVVCMAEFGRTPRMNPSGGRDHWGHVFSVALAGGGIRGRPGLRRLRQDRRPSQGRQGRPQDLTATIFHCLGLSPETEMHGCAGSPPSDQPRRGDPANNVDALTDAPSSARRLPGRIDRHIQVQEKIEGIPEEEIARVSGRGPGLGGLQQAGMNARFHGQFRAEVGISFTVWTAHEPGSQRSAAAQEKCHLAGNTDVGKNFAVLAYRPFGQGRGLLGRQRDASPANPDQFVL